MKKLILDSEEILHYIRAGIENDHDLLEAVLDIVVKDGEVSVIVHWDTRKQS